MHQMKSRSFDFKKSPTDLGKHNKTFDFISLYKSAAENSNILGNNDSGDGIDKENSFIRSQKETPRRGLSPNKKKKKGKQEPLDLSRINIEGPTLAANLRRDSPLNQSKITSTPRSSNNDKSQVKSIMKNSSVVNDDTMDSSQSQYNSKPKKRNKSVSFMLEENEEVVSKKTKSEECFSKKKKSPEKSKPVKLAKTDISKEKKLKKVGQQAIEKSKAVGDAAMETEPVQSSEKEVPATVNDVEGPSVSGGTKQKKKKKLKLKKYKKIATTASESNNNELATDNKNKKVNKKKRKGKSSQPTDVEIDEPAAKSRKKEVKPEVIARNLENLTIGDNPHTLTSLLDEMTVADKDKKKKNKRKLKKDNVQTPKAETEAESEGVKEKVKWTKKWNKGKKDIGSNVALSVIVENLPLSLICSYKTMLAEHFEKCGTIKKIGVAEVYPNESNTGFTTTIQFDSETAASAALSEDGASVEGNIIQVKRPLPPTETTLVVRSYASLSDQSISSTFGGLGRIRSIRRLAKSKKAIETVFIEFDGPEAVERAIELTKGAKVDGKRMHVTKFEYRNKLKKKRVKAPAREAPVESDGEADSEDSND